MSLFETINLIKNYEEEIKNNFVYVEKINYVLRYNPIFVSNLKMQLLVDLRLKQRIKHIGKQYSYSILPKLFPELFVEKILRLK